MQGEAAFRHLAVTDGNYLSHTTRTLEVARQLRSAGDEVIFAASGRYARIIDEAGFERREIVTPDPEYIMSMTRRSRMDYLRGQLLEDVVSADIEAIRDVAPDAVLGDFRWSLSISTEVTSVFYATILNTLWTHHYAMIRSVPEGFLLRKLIGERPVAAVGPLVKRIMLNLWGRPFNRYRARLGLPPRQNLNYHFYGDLVLLADLPSLFPTHPLPPGVEIVGPIFWKHGVPPTSGALPPPSSRPLVYASIGSTGTPLFLEKLFHGFKGRDCDVVMSTGGQKLGVVPPANFTCVDLVRAEDVLPRAALAVCHGGNGTVYQCLAHGVPLAGIATHNDQQWNLDRVAALGLGWRFTQESIKPERLGECLDQVLQDPSWRARVAAIAREIHASDGASVAAAAIRRALLTREKLVGVAGR